MSLISIDCSLRSWRDMFWRPSHKKIGLRSKNFSFVSEQTKTSDLAALEMEQAPFFARSLTLVPRSLLRNRAKVLVTQTTRRLGSSQKIGRRLQESVDQVYDSTSITKVITD